MQKCKCGKNDYHLGLPFKTMEMECLCENAVETFKSRFSQMILYLKPRTRM